MEILKRKRDYWISFQWNSVGCWNLWGLFDFIRYANLLAFHGAILQPCRQKLTYRKLMVMQIVPSIKMEMVPVECSVSCPMDFGLFFPVLPAFVNLFHHLLPDYKGVVV